MSSPATGNAFVTVPNLLSLLRAGLAIPFTAVMLSSLETARLWGVAIMALAMLTDKLDGVLARKYHTSTEWGRILDPLADKIGVAAVGLVLLYLGDIPLWFVVALVGRDAMILAGGVLVKRRTGVVLPSNKAGKWAVGVVAATLLLALVGIHGPVLDGGLVVSTSMLALSLWLYVKRFLETMRRPNGTA